MKRLAKFALSISVAAVLLAGCGVLPLSLSKGQDDATHVDRGGSWMLPEAKRDDLLYVVDEGTRAVSIYSYPHEKLVGTLTGFDYPTGDCVDKAGDVWIVDQGGDDVAEFAHGGMAPLQTLTLPGRGEIYPISCSSDQASGNLAITSWYGGVYVYLQAQGTPKRYSAHWYSNEDCAYDDNGNLYVDAEVGNEFYQQAALYELKKKASTLKRLHFRPGIGAFGWIGGLQWDGKQIAFGDRWNPASYDRSVIYQIGQRGRAVREISSTKLVVDGLVNQFWIEGRTVIAPSYQPSEGGEVALYNYPAGGSPISSITGLDQPVAVAVSRAK